MAAHVDEQGAVQSAIGTQDPTLAARIEVQADAVAEPDETLGKINSTIEEAAKHGHTDAALSAIDGQRKARQVPAGKRQREASTLADLKAERATLGANGRQIEADGPAPTRYVAKPIGTDTDSDWTFRWLLALMALCCDPPAKALTTAASARNRPQSDAALPKIMDDVLRIAD